MRSASRRAPARCVRPAAVSTPSRRRPFADVRQYRVTASGPASAAAPRRRHTVPVPGSPACARCPSVCNPRGGVPRAAPRPAQRVLLRRRSHGLLRDRDMPPTSLPCRSPGQTRSSRSQQVPRLRRLTYLRSLHSGIAKSGERQFGNCPSRTPTAPPAPPGVDRSRRPMTDRAPWCLPASGKRDSNCRGRKQTASRRKRRCLRDRTRPQRGSRQR
ncbi:Uncharacterised protein [Mycobacteroides abscessus subsp. abscessus]|nr:Uncharacterised protein [Mycobacteroides abscessus subsp. abscessus]